MQSQDRQQRLRHAEEDWRSVIFRMTDVPLQQLQNPESLAEYIRQLKNSLSLSTVTPNTTVTSTSVSGPHSTPKITPSFLSSERQICNSIAAGSTFYQEYIDRMIDTGALFVVFLSSQDARFGRDTPLIYLFDLIKQLEEGLLAHLNTLSTSPQLSGCRGWDRFVTSITEQIKLRFRYYRDTRVPSLQTRYQDSWAGFRWIRFVALPRLQVPLSDTSSSLSLDPSTLRVPRNTRMAENAFLFCTENLESEMSVHPDEPVALPAQVPGQWMSFFRFLEKVICTPLLFPCSSSSGMNDPPRWSSFMFPFPTLPPAREELVV